MTDPKRKPPADADDTPPKGEPEPDDRPVEERIEEEGEPSGGNFA